MTNFFPPPPSLEQLRVWAMSTASLDALLLRCSADETWARDGLQAMLKRALLTGQREADIRAMKARITRPR